MNIIDYLGDSTFDYFEDILRTARRSNPAYGNAVKEQSRHSSIELEDTPGFLGYMQAYHDAARIENKLFYHQGYRDCICLLKSLSVLPSEKGSVCSDW